MSARTSVVTGAGGFAGAWLCRALLRRGDAVVGWVRRAPLRPVPGVRYALVDVTDEGACRDAAARHAPHRLFHLAAVTHPGDAARDPARAQAVNVQGTRNVFGALPPGTPAVVASTVHVYGPPQSLPLSEGHPVAPRGVYARTKADAEAAALDAHDAVVLARAFHHTGPGQAPRYALADWAQQLARGRRVLRTGDVSLRRDYADVRDIVDGYIALSERAAPGAVVNLCTGRAPRLRDLIALMAPEAPVRIQEQPDRRRPDDPRVLVGDPRQALALGWRARRPLSAALRSLVAGFRLS